jgi:mannan endo-1,4-beta-mannosidase
MKGKKLKQACSVIFAGALLVSGISAGSFMTTTAASDEKYEFEDGDIVGATIQESGTERYMEGASGDKFVFLENGSETASVTVNVDTAGMYNVTLCYSTPYGAKTHNIYINGVDQGQFSLVANDEWTEINLGSYKLNEGENTITVKSGWGWTNIDYIKIEEATMPTISASQTTCCDTDATSETQNLMSYLASVYGEHIISGQQEIYKYGPHDFSYEFDYIENLTGKLPAIRGFDFLNCNPLYGSDDGTTDRIIEWVNTNNGIATASWHITVPKDFDSYTLGDSVSWSDSTYVPGDTNFDTSQAIVEGTKEYEYYMLCLKNLAAEFQKLQDENVPIIFRPLHEAEGGGGETGSWFWWGKSGSAVYKELWKLTYETLTETYGLHNIIWEWNSYAYDTSADWYPGDDMVDIIAYDKYNCTDWSTGSAVLNHNDSAISGTFYNIMEKYGSTKMVAMAENDSIPTLSNLVTEKAGWLYFCPWYDGGSDSTNFLTNEVFNRQEDLIEIYQSDYCITLDELPATLYSEKSEITTTTENTTSAVEGVYGDADGDGDVDIDDVVAVTCYVADSVENALSDDALVLCDVYEVGSGVNGMDALSMQKYLVKVIDSLPETID